MVKKSFYPLDNGTRVTPQLLADLLPIFSAITLLLFALLIIFSAQKICSKRAQRPSIKSWPWNESTPKSGCNMDTSLCSVASDSDYNQSLFYNSKRIDRVDFHSPHDISFTSTLPSKAVMISNPADSEWEFPRHHLRILGKLGEGCFGKVWKCEAFNISGKEGATIVAVKTIKEGATERDRQDLKCELETMKLLEPHSNVVSLLGCCTEIEPNFLILEYAPFGTLQSYLRDGRTERLYDNILGAFSAKDLTSFGFQVAKGMEYISSKGIIHRDLAARNVLMSNNKTCKISDFGFSRKVAVDQIYQHKTEGRLPIRWMSPEALYENKFSSKSDIWSFGILMWEIVTLGSTPYLGLSTKEVMKKVKEGYRPEKPDHCKREFYNIMFYCWHENPDERPMFSELAKMLENLISSENDYIELDRFPDHCYYNVLSNMSGEKL